MTLAKAIPHSRTHFVPVLEPSHAQDARMDGWWTLDWQSEGCRGLGGRKRKPDLSHFTLLKWGQKQNPDRKQPKSLCLQGLETVLCVPMDTPLQGRPQPSTMRQGRERPAQGPGLPPHTSLSLWPKHHTATRFCKARLFGESWSFHLSISVPSARRREERDPYQLHPEAWALTPTFPSTSFSSITI